jgi:transposase
MSEKQLEKHALTVGALEGKYTVGCLAKRLDMSERWIKQLKKAVKERGAAALVHGNSKRHPANVTKGSIREEIVRLKKSSAYENFNFKYFRKKLEEREGIKAGYSAVCRILKEAGLASKRKHTEKKRFKRRSRRERLGEMLQADSTPCAWFGDGVNYALHGFIDDADGIITGLYLTRNECLLGYLEVLRQTVAK